MPVKPHELFERMVLKGKGSYCFGQNGLFLGMLRGLGYRFVLLMPAESKLNEPWCIIYRYILGHTVSPVGS